MPNYDFRCDKCGDVFDKIITLDEYKPEQPCQKKKCKGKAKRLFNKVNISTKITNKSGRWGGDFIKHRQKFDK